MIPNAVKTIKEGAFSNCAGLTAVTLGVGLEEIGENAFASCILLERITIPRNVKSIHDTAFTDCTNLTSVQFCDEIENFVSCDAMRSWWNAGVHERSLSTYCLLVQFDIPGRVLALARVSSWQVNIYEMMRIIPAITAEGMYAHFDAIDYRLIYYEDLLTEAPTLFPDRLGLDYGVVLNILSFL